MARPTVEIRIAFTNTPFQASSALTWVDVTSRVRTSADGGSPITIRRGRQSELGRIEAGTLNLMLDNRDRTFDPLNTSGAYYPNILPMKRIQVRALWSGVYYYLFTGYIEAWQPTYPGGRDALVQVRASDLFKPIARTTVTVVSIPPGETSNNAVRTALLNIGWPVATDYSATAGKSLVPAGSYANQNTLSYIQQIVESEAGLFYIDGDGTPTFQDRHWRLQNATPLAVFGDRAQGLTVTTLSGAHTSTTTTITVGSAVNFPSYGTVLIDSEKIIYTGTTSNTLTGCTRGALGTTAASHSNGAAVTYQNELLYESLTLAYDETFLYNIVRATRRSGTEQQAEDITSEASYGPRVLTKTDLLLGTDGEVLSYAQWLLYNYKDPIVRPPTLTINGEFSDATIWPHALGRDLSEAIVVRARPPGGGVVDLTVRIEAVTHTIDLDSWRTIWQLSTTTNEDWMTLDSTTRGQLDSTHRLAF